MKHKNEIMIALIIMAVVALVYYLFSGPTGFAPQHTKNIPGITP